jgi:hypothetical protein
MPGAGSRNLRESPARRGEAAICLAAWGAGSEFTNYRGFRLRPQAGRDSNFSCRADRCFQGFDAGEHGLAPGVQGRAPGDPGQNPRRQRNIRCRIRIPLSPSQGRRQEREGIATECPGRRSRSRGFRVWFAHGLEIGTAGTGEVRICVTWRQESEPGARGQQDWRADPDPGPARLPEGPHRGTKTGEFSPSIA